MMALMDDWAAAADMSWAMIRIGLLYGCSWKVTELAAGSRHGSKPWPFVRSVLADAADVAAPWNLEIAHGLRACRVAIRAVILCETP
jgi:hypothetical protein